MGAVPLMKNLMNGPRIPGKGTTHQYLPGAFRMSAFVMAGPLGKTLSTLYLIESGITVPRFFKLLVTNVVLSNKAISVGAPCYLSTIP